MKKIVVFGGWFGSRNAGDEAIMLAVVELLSAQWPEAQIVVHSIDGDYTETLGHVKSLATQSDRSKLGKAFALAREYVTADLFVVTGGTPIFDYYLASRAFHLGIPIIARTPVVYFGIGVKPVTSTRGRLLYRFLLDRAKFISVRDREVERQLRSIGVKSRISLTADSAIVMASEEATTHAQHVLLDAGIDLNRPTIALCPIFLSDDFREHFHEPVSRVDRERSYIALASVGDEMLRQGYQVVVVPMHQVAPDDDSEVVRTVVDLMVGGAVALLPPEDPRVIKELLASMHLVVAMRLHASVLATSSAVPTVSIGFDMKVRTYMEYLDLSDYFIPISEVTSENLIATTLSLLENRDAVHSKLVSTMEVWEDLVRNSAARMADSL